MSKERFNQILEKVFINYCQTKIEKTSTGEIWTSYAGHYGIISKEEFINKCKTDPEFSQKWGLTIEERELSTQERKKLCDVDPETECRSDAEIELYLALQNIPTKLITLTYQNEKIETYE